jgi:single-strand DNA-binding protein
MSLKNHVQLIGHLGQEPKLIASESGNKIMSVSMATNDSFKDKSGQKQVRTEWHNLIAFGTIAETFTKFLKKGSNIIVSGSLQTRQYTDKTGVERWKTEVVVDNMSFLDKVEA